MQVEVFKTSVVSKHQAEALTEQLRQNLSACRINFDLEDCDKVLRIEATAIQPFIIVEILKRQGFECEVLN